MDCPHWGSGETSRRRTARGSRTSACRACRRTFNERTGTPVNDLQYPTDIVLLAVLWRLRYTRSFRDVAALLLERGFGVTHETIRMLGVPLRAAPGRTGSGPSAEAAPASPGPSMRPP